MDKSTTDEWHQILVQTMAHEQGTADRILVMVASLNHPRVAAEMDEQFADEWDQTSFDPDHPTQPPSHFEPMVREVLGTLRAA
jgi:hypothetical protein